jgi:hypothetical protein
MIQRYQNLHLRDFGDNESLLGLLKNIELLMMNFHGLFAINFKLWNLVESEKFSLSLAKLNQMAHCFGNVLSMKICAA